MSSIKSLLSADGKIYIYLATANIGKQFLQDAESEGFLFCDGVKPTKREPDFIFAVNSNMTINYVGFVGRVAYQAANKVGGKLLVKIDYRDILNQAK
ncbi:MAG: hypothetical protein Q4C21_09580 [Oscillospiraceae bacterium]|nr:hypothetical protein [Oscillospiraceae bacterium]